MPTTWKCANVTPLPKTSNPKSPDTDLRPISLTPILSKILEGFVFQWIWDIVREKIDPYQFGGVKNSSTSHCLVELLHIWLSATDRPKTSVQSCMIDFSKAFDRIDHNILLNKLRRLEVPQILLNWCASFLHDRKQRVRVGNELSDWLPVLGGVPQGTKLGPLFFIIMINDMSCKLPIYKFVDDCTVFEVLQPFTTSILQEELNGILKWADDNDMVINSIKTKGFNICFSRSPPNFDQLELGGNLETVTSAKLLGVFLTSDLKWNTHIDYICGKASKRLYALRTLKRSGVLSDELRSAYCCYVRPILEYACPVWHTSLPNYLHDQLERVQRRATKIIMPDLDYKERLTRLNIQTLRERRDSLCFKFFKSILHSSSSSLTKYLPECNNCTYSLRSQRAFQYFKCKTNRFKNSFLPALIARYNNNDNN